MLDCLSDREVLVLGCGDEPKVRVGTAAPPLRVARLDESKTIEPSAEHIKAVVSLSENPPADKPLFQHQLGGRRL